MSATTVIDGLLDPFSQCLDAGSAKRVADFRVAPAVQKRIARLAALANEGMLGGDERDEYEAAINAADLIAILKIKAQRQILSENG